MPKPIIFLAFANAKVDYARYLQNLPAELSQIRQALQTVQELGFCGNVTDNSININQKNKEADNLIGSDFFDKIFRKKE